MQTAARKLEGSVALVTGAGHRLGRVFAQAAALNGAAVAVHFNTSATEANEVVKAIISQSGKAVAIQADLSSHLETIHLFQRAVNHFGKVDILINSASVFESKNFMDTDIKTWRRNLDVHATAPFILAREMASNLGGRKGNIINILDWRHDRPDPAHFAYSVSKAALASLTANLAVALAPLIRVNGLAPGVILPLPGETAISQAILGKIPMKRPGLEDEVSQAIQFLLTGPEYMTGETLYLDGGRQWK
jgi:pteridine reductase